MTSEPSDRLTSFRAEAIERGVPAEDVDRWTTLARPCATMTLRGDGPVVGRFGGPLLLPADVPDQPHPLVASVDLAALPADVTDLPLPPDGLLLLFAWPEDETCYGDAGSVVHVPAGTPVVERDGNAWNGSGFEEYEEMFGRFPEGPLRLTADVSLPHHHLVELAEAPWVESLPGHPHAEKLTSAWDRTPSSSDFRGSLQLGGYSAEEVVDVDPVTGVVSDALRASDAGKVDGPVSSDVADWVLLADWHTDIEGWEGASVHWAVQRDDLAARRFDRVFVTCCWNP
ncbi:DUF1963 domain-containing protein [Umezawaea beigongshangensis]|uniref:DUF1963 domain-containing protein n=1 Tax=Umezawaea beigongshangensis TaxID=2780383 RepID=UPI0018F14DAB|nr:DUF1963 domain-containing protein [Umezawaea beigongshangensis]